MPFRLLIAALVFLAAPVSGVFADAEEVVGAPVSESGSGTPSAQVEPENVRTEDPGAERERQKAMDDVNAFLIESYKIKLDKTLAEVYESVRSASKDDPALQVALLRRILTEIEAKVSVLTSAKQISPNRKKILLSVFTYLRFNIESKIRTLKTAEE